jgi:AGZA family xanthine/uracil permease-like MFS transporter
MTPATRLLDRLFRLRAGGTTARTEILAGTTTFLTMAYIIFVQPAVLSGALFGFETGMDFGAVTTATCVAAALGSILMGIYARYPIAQAPGMGENFFFVFSALPGAAAAGFEEPWRVALGVVFLSGILFVLVTLLGLQKRILRSISPSLRNGIAVGIGLFIAFIGLQNAGLIVKDPGTAVRLNASFLSPDLLVFFTGLLATAALRARGVRGAILWGIGIALAMSLALRALLPVLPSAIATSATVHESMLMTRFTMASRVVGAPPSIAPTFLRMDLGAALSLAMVPYVVIFLFMDLFDTLGTLVGVSERAGFVQDDGTVPRAQPALLSDAVGTVVGAGLGTSTVTSFIESVAGVETGGRTGLTAVTAGILFLLALFFSPVIGMVGSYPPITAPALVVVGALMMGNVRRIAWDDPSEAVPAFLIVLGIPLTYSVADGIALGFISYPFVKVLGGRRREVSGLMTALAVLLALYFALLRGRIGN